MGDFELEECGLISDPFINVIEITNDDKFIVIATDGLFDVCADEEILIKYNDFLK